VTGPQRFLRQAFAVMAEAMNFREKRLDGFGTNRAVKLDVCLLALQASKG
jgi:hypothetical protein